MPKKKTSPHKIEANRRNAKKSTGPRSAAGKAKVSRNAVKHGLLAGRIVLADHADEDPQQFGLLLDGLVHDYHPQGTIETMLVERLAASFWRLRRAYRFEVEAIKQANRPNPLADALKELAPLPPAERGECVLPSPRSLDRLIRYETMIDRELLRTMRQLELRQRLRKMDQSLQIQEEQHGQAYSPMPPDRSVPRSAAADRPRTEKPKHGPQPPGKKHGQAYLPMPPGRAKRPRQTNPPQRQAQATQHVASGGALPPRGCPRRPGVVSAAILPYNEQGQLPWFVRRRTRRAKCHVRPWLSQSRAL